MALKKWNTNFPFGHSARKTGLPFKIFLCSWKFSAGTTQVVFNLLSNRIFRKPFVNRKKTSHYSRACAKTNIVPCYAQFFFFFGACLHERRINKVQRCIYCRFTLQKSLEDPTLYQNDRFWLYFYFNFHILPPWPSPPRSSINTK